MPLVAWLPWQYQRRTGSLAGSQSFDSRVLVDSSQSTSYTQIQNDWQPLSMMTDWLILLNAPVPEKIIVSSVHLYFDRDWPPEREAPYPSLLLQSSLSKGWTSQTEMKNFMKSIPSLLSLQLTFSSLALIRSSWMHRVIASVLRTTSSWLGKTSCQWHFH